MTNPTWPGAQRDSGWSQLSLAQKASLIGAGVLIVVLGLLTLIGATTRPSGRPAPTPQASSPAPAAQSNAVIRIGR